MVAGEDLWDASASVPPDADARWWSTMYERVARIQRFTSELLAARSTDQVVQALVAEVLASGAATVAVTLLAGDRLVLAGQGGYADGVLERFGDLDLERDRDLPVVQAARERTMLRIHSSTALAAGDVRVAEAVEATGNKSWAAVPIQLEDRVLGALWVGFAEVQPFVETHTFADDDLAFIEALAVQAAQALDRMQSYERVEGARHEAEAARERLSFLVRAGDVLNGSLSLDVTLQRLVEVVVPGVAEWCAVHLLDARHVPVLAAAAHRQRSRRADIEALYAHHPVRLDAVWGTGAVLRTGRAELHPHLGESAWARISGDPAVLRVLRRLGLGSLVSVPLLRGDDVLGALTFAARRPGALGETELALARDLATRAAVAIENARLHERTGHLLTTLQRSLLPPALPAIPGAELAACYRPGVGDIGGDFYDVFALRGDTWGVVLGDVSGRGTEAAALTALARHAVRGAAMAVRRPAQVLAVLNQALVEEPELDRFCTAVFARLKPDRDGLQLTLARAGHPFPLLVRADGAVVALHPPGDLLGVRSEAELVDDIVGLDPGDVLVLYTDGLTECRGPRGRFGSERLRRLLARHAGARATEVVAALEAAIADHAGGPVGDDVAILAVRAV